MQRIFICRLKITVCAECGGTLAASHANAIDVHWFVKPKAFAACVWWWLFFNRCTQQFISLSSQMNGLARVASYPTFNGHWIYKVITLIALCVWARVFGHITSHVGVLEFDPVIQCWCKFIVLIILCCMYIMWVRVCVSAPREKLSFRSKSTRRWWKITFSHLQVNHGCDACKVSIQFNWLKIDVFSSHSRTLQKAVTSFEVNPLWV